MSMQAMLTHLSPSNANACREGMAFAQSHTDPRTAYYACELIGWLTWLAGSLGLRDELRLFARQAALSVSHLWDMPDLVREYLVTGNETLRVEARRLSLAAAPCPGTAAADAAADAAYAAYAAAYAAADAAADAAYAAAYAADADAADAAYAAAYAADADAAYAAYAAAYAADADAAYAAAAAAYAADADKILRVGCALLLASHRGPTPWLDADVLAAVAEAT